jgi:aspartyl-tRNA(Asn)/glutamyl-tRNA(Gln) amidotransferase subunit C
MEITPELIQRLATLSKLRFEDGEDEAIMNDLNRIVAFMDKLNELDVTGVEPLIYLSDRTYKMEPESKSGLRPDQAAQTISHEEALKNAPKRDSDYFRVPKVLEKKG